jgi:hypothetical protein
MVRITLEANAITTEVAHTESLTDKLFQTLVADSLNKC